MDNFWIHPIESRIGKIQHGIKETTGSFTFCPLPWIHIATRPNGDARLCCGSNASGAQIGDHTIGLVKDDTGRPANFGRDSLESAFNNSYMCNVRKTMLDGKIPRSCTKCFEEEANGVVSKRMWETYEWSQDELDLKELVRNTDENGCIPFKVQYLDLRLGHTCNLKCVMCTPHDSSRWTQDHAKLTSSTKNETILNQIQWDSKTFNNEWYSKDDLWEEIFTQIPNIKRLYFAGGEPLMIKEHYTFLNEIVKRGFADQICLRYNSNGSFVNSDVIDLWSNFKQVRYAFSIDDLSDRNHYIRYPADWNEIEKNLDLLDDSPSNIECSIACTVQVLNIGNIINFAKWKINKQYKKINKFKLDAYEVGGGIINLHLLYIPTFLSARILSQEDKMKIRNQILDFKEWLYEHYRQDKDFWEDNPFGWKRWEAILKFVEAEDHSYLLPSFKEYISKLDKIRNTDSKVIFPELKHLL